LYVFGVVLCIDEAFVDAPPFDVCRRLSAGRRPSAARPGHGCGTAVVI
jgi:hypothetical protein